MDMLELREMNKRIVQFSPLTYWVVWFVLFLGGGDTRDDRFQTFLQKAIVNDSGMGRDVHSFTFSIQHFLC